MNDTIKGFLMTAATIVVVLIALRYIAGAGIPVASAVAQKAVG